MEPLSRPKEQSVAKLEGFIEPHAEIGVGWQGRWNGCGMSKKEQAAENYCNQRKFLLFSALSFSNFSIYVSKERQ